MDTIAGEILLWEEGRRLYARVTTNVSCERLLGRLSALGLRNLVESVHGDCRDRAHGGNGFVVCWKEHVHRDDIRGALLSL